MGLLILIVLVLLLAGVAPNWRYSRNWGYGPTRFVGALLILMVVLLLLGHVRVY